ncbi:DUF2283 domain-containing protein [Halomicronema sp. CCY15110]|uniref:DUF2283 domain-containing protein n=1 Tax=Halomicronema sp. CCY15110 TaxID=2767773 RepID=UPI001951D7B2|nr:DUF2283 domain-containing protein [Halomicronema sp. CCY15110]
MKQKYSPETDTLYIEIDDSPSFESEAIDENLIIDFDENGKAVGITLEHYKRKQSIDASEATSSDMTNVQFSGEIKRTNSSESDFLANLTGEIELHQDGRLFLRISKSQEELLSEKLFLDSAPIYRGSDIDRSDLLSFQNAEKISEPYNGEYSLIGEDASGRKITGILSDKNFKVGFSPAPESSELSDETQVFRSLKDLSLGDYSTSEIAREINIFLSGIDVFRDTSVLIDEVDFQVDFIRSGNTPKSIGGQVITQLRIRKKDSSPIAIKTLEKYISRIVLILSFASGKYIEEIHRHTIFENGDLLEFWPGVNLRKLRRGLQVIQTPHLPGFIQQSILRIRDSLFDEKKLALALSWYLDSFNSAAVSVEFLLLSTVFETLSKAHDPDLTSYKARVESLLDSYSVEYDDLFSSLREFISVRNDIVHEGFGGVGDDGSNIADTLRRLTNLLVRTFLSMLNYSGDYMEYIRHEVEIEDGVERHGRICRTWPITSQ